MPEEEILSYRKNEEGVALLIDWENIKISLLEQKKSPDIDLLLETVDKYGQRGVSKAYANWQHHRHLHNDQSRFLMRAIETVQILGRNPNSGRVIKNSADVAMAVEAVRLCYKQPDLTTFILVTGDGDLIHLVNELKRNRNKVVIIGVSDSVSRVLSEAADEVLYYDKDIAVKKQNTGQNTKLELKQDAKQDARQGTKANTSENSQKNIQEDKLELSTIYSWIAAVLHNHYENSITLPALGQRLWRKHRFAAKQLNMNLSNLVEKMLTVKDFEKQFSLDGDLLKKKLVEGTVATEAQVSDTSPTAKNLSFWARLKKQQIHKEVLKFTVTKVLETGLKGNLDGVDIEALLPNGQIDLRHIEKPIISIGEVLDVHVIEVDSVKEHLVVSRSSVKNQEAAKKRKKILNKLKVGNIITGEVVEITDFGVFVNIGGLDGLIHKSELVHKRIKHPGEVVNIGDKIEVEVVEIDQYKERVSLSMKRLQMDPWHDLAKKYPVGTQVKGTVTNVVSYGAFVELEPNLSALIHISELGLENNNIQPSEILKVGQRVDAEVIIVNEAKKRLALKLQKILNSTDKPASSSKQNKLLDNHDDQQLLVFEAKQPVSKKDDANSGKKSKLKNVTSGTSESPKNIVKKTTKKELLVTIPPEIGRIVETNSFEAEAKNIDKTVSANSSINDLNQESGRSSVNSRNNQEMRLLTNFLDQHSQPYPLNEIFKELSQKHDLKLADFKANIKQAHSDGWLKLVRHNKNKKLYATLSKKPSGEVI